MRLAIVAVALAAAGASPTAQAPAAAPSDAGRVTVSSSLRTRIESSNWFGDDPGGEYSYSGSLVRLSVGQSKARVDWNVEVAAPVLIGLPDRAIAPGARGAQGLGAAYFSANDRRDTVASLFVKQAFVRIKQLGGIEGQSFKAGRMEFVDGAEVVPKNTTLAVVKRDRIAHRLLGTFGFSHVGRSLDGVQYGLDRPGTNVTVMLARPTRGVFQVDGWGELNVMVVYGAVTGQISGSTHAGEWRVFGLGYRDNRDSVLKTDNRQLEGRLADTESIDLATFGGHTLYAVETAAGAIDLLAWGAVQTGSWGELAQRGGAFSVEAGWQPNVLDAIQPWIRGGWQYGSGDHDPADTTHGTFFQVLPTPRVYARFPFFNMMNISDAFGELRIRPSKAVTIRSDVHVLHLADPNDFWYQGGGAFQTSTFGYTGRPSSGQSNLATLYDVSGDITVGPHASIGAYLSYAAAQPVSQAIYDSATGARFGYVELSVRF